MAFAKPTKFTSWSFSRYSTYKQCPLKAYHAYIAKTPTTMPKSPAMERGNDIHKAIEAYLKGESRAVPKDTVKASEELKALRAAIKAKPHLATVEETIALRSDWSTTTWNDWTGCWVRIKTDLMFVSTSDDGDPIVHIRDWKTGRYRPENQTDYIEQIGLYALGGLIRWGNLPNVVVKPQLVYTDHGIEYPADEDVQEFTPKDLPALKKDWEKKVKPMMNDTKFAPKPNQFCRFCEYGVSKGGTCKFG